MNEETIELNEEIKELIEEGYKWIARDADDWLRGFDRKPSIFGDYWDDNSSNYITASPELEVLIPEDWEYSLIKLEDLLEKEEITFKIGDKVRLKKGLVDGRYYGETCFYYEYMSFEGEKTIVETNKNGDFRLNGMGGFIYTHKMLELVEETEKHDSHYSKQKIEPMQVLEQIVLTNIPEELHEQVLLNFRIAMGAKYVLRTGHKDNYIKELQKAQNYLKRAETGDWL